MGKIINLLKLKNDFNNQDDLILRDRLAIVRTKLANERTLFSYIRTSLYLLTAGVGILEIESIEHLKIIAYVSLFFSGVLFFMGLVKFYQLNKLLRNYVPDNRLTKDMIGKGRLD